ncbi:hypothetical protein N431DRAFT_509888 [Stipitochalara longipes BDJ]|nr:hypothetical protein N431DRAFT_509888 [Stipitochalara longipes BDJ]
MQQQTVHTLSTSLYQPTTHLHRFQPANPGPRAKMHTSVPDPKTWRPSEKEWYPRLHIGQHWQDMSIPLYCYLEQTAAGQFSEIKWAIRPLGDPLNGKPSWTNFTLPINSMVNQIACLSYGMRQELMSSMKVSITAKYVGQLKFDAGAPVYREEDLEKRGRGVKQSEQHDTSAMDTSGMETTSMGTSGPNTPTIGIPGLNMSGMGTSGMNTSHKDTSHKDAAGMSSIRPEEDNPPTPRPGMGAFTGSNRSPIQLEDERGSSSMAGNSAKRSKTKAENPNHTPTGPRKWSYIEQYDARKPSNLRH